MIVKIVLINWKTNFTCTCRQGDQKLSYDLEWPNVTITIIRHACIAASICLKVTRDPGNTDQ